MDRSPFYRNGTATGQVSIKRGVGAPPSVTTSDGPEVIFTFTCQPSRLSASAVLTSSVVALNLCVLIASIIPAQHAASIDPVKALRIE
jgi:ABC-type lipoprotein release transport system permease subunit